MAYQAIKLAQYPDGYIDEQTFTKVTCESAPLKEGEFRVAVSHLSLDPAMRGWVSPDPNSYIPPVKIGEVMRSLGFGTVTESKNPDFPIGAHVSGLTGWTEEVISDGKTLSVIPHNLAPELALSVLGMPGQTAYIGYKDILQPEAGKTLVVTGAAGAVGSTVVQMAVADGVKVIAIAGSDEKCKWLSELGAHTVINYKKDNLAQAFNKCAPNGIDYFFENTGGEVQHIVIDKINPHGRVAVCGLIADYHSATPALAPSWINLIKRRASIQGFTITDHYHRIPQIIAGLSNYLQAGKLHASTHVIEGLDSAITGVNMLFKGENTGKLIVKL